MNNVSLSDVEVLLDLWLTAHGGRDACLHPTDAFSPLIYDFATQWGLTWRILEDELENEAVFTCKPELLDFDWGACLKREQEYVGKILGYTLSKMDFPSTERAHATFSISAVGKGWKTAEGRVDAELQLFAYVAERVPRIHEIGERTVAQWTRIFEQHPFPFVEELRLQFAVEYVDGVAERRQGVDDWTYVQRSYKQYYADVMAKHMDRIGEFLALMARPPTAAEWTNIRELWLRAVQ